MILLFYSGQILEKLGQEPVAAKAAENYILMLLPGMFAMTQFETIRRYLQSMGIFDLTMYIQVATTCLHFVWCYLFIYYFNLGVTGAALAACITYWTNLIVVSLILTYGKEIVPNQAWHLPNVDSLKDWWKYLRYGVPSCLMMCLEWWSFEALTVFAGWLRVEQLAANVIFVSLINFLFNFALGISYAVANLVGNSLGQRKPKKAKRYFNASVWLVLVFGVIMLIVMNYLL